MMKTKTMTSWTHRGPVVLWMGAFLLWTTLWVSPALGQSRVLDESSIRGYEYTGPYAQFGITVGAIEFDGIDETDAGGGFAMTGGYRILPWLSAEGNVTYMGGADLDNSSADAEFFSFTFGPKIYPLGALEEQPLPELFQPYALIGIGGGEFEIDGLGGRSVEESTFIARFILGFDVWLTDHWGTFVEGGYHVAEDDDIDGAGVFTFGGQYRF